ncbi:MAG: glycosyltransferase [candidate division Zixibacteria bacterium]|nr:glycosyltransferase [candidate division Zixibacteria bacterium]
MPRSLLEYEEIVGKINISILRQLADNLKGARVVHVNSTRVGGGVAEILDWLVSLMNDLGLEASWEVISGPPEFYYTTKTFHNALQGKASSLTKTMIEAYEDTNQQTADKLRGTLEDADFVIIHDPQPAALLEHFPNRKGKWIWRCHIDASRPYRKVWKYLEEKVVNYDASIFSMPSFAKRLPHPQFIIAPSIDPLSDKNRELEDSEIKAAMETYGIENSKPVLTQISRFDRFKDPIGVIQAFNMLRETIDADLILAGGGASDDPEGQMVLEEVLEEADGDRQIHILNLPGDAHRMINALQRASTIVLQKSLQEGFGLTVTEALWKEKPVIGGNVGGIKLQVHNHHTGFLVNTPEGAALRMRYLLRHPEELEYMGKTGRRFVQENFLLTRHLREYLTLMLGLRRGLANYLITE